MDQELYATLSSAIAALAVIDCHEHTFLPTARPRPMDLWEVVRNSDLGDDLIAAGMPAASRPVLDWERAAPYLPAVRNTGFYQSLVLAFRDLFDFQADELTATNWPALSEHIQRANERSDWYAEVLQRRANIALILRVQGDEPDPYLIERNLFAPLIRFDSWILATDPEARERVTKQFGGAAHSLAGYLAALDTAVDMAVARGAVGLKSMLAYQRSLAHTRPVYADIARLFAEKTLSDAEARAFEDFMMHEVAARAGRCGLPYQLHVGYGSWQHNITAQANPLLLNPLIEAHRQTQFVLLHGGYPFVGELGTLAKNHPNVYIESGWLAYIAPVVYRRALSEWLDSVPMNKILAFGADCLCVEQTYGALLLTRRLLAQTLTEKIEHDRWNVQLAKEVAWRLLSQNAVDLYHLDVKT
jgi:uncharacterized protein